MTSNLTLRSLSAYESSPEDPAIALRLDRTEPPIPFRGVVPYNPSQSWSRYPSAKDLEAKLANRFGIGRENVIVTAGADEALDRTSRVSLLSGDILLTTTPTFEMIDKYGRLANATIDAVPWLSGEFPSDKFQKKISTRTRLIVLVSPNNPTGKCIPLKAIEQIALRNSNILIVLDLAYVEFAESDPTLQLLRFPNIMVARSFSKAWGLPGLRLGYALSSTDVIQAMRAAGGPYSVAASSIEAVNRNFARFEGEMREYVEKIKQERCNLEQWLDTNGVQFIPSQSNFILLFPNNVEYFDETLRSFGIQTRSFTTIPAARRLTLPGNTEAFELLQTALEETFQLQSIEL